MHRAPHYGAWIWFAPLGRGDKLDLPWRGGFYSPGRYLSRKAFLRPVAARVATPHCARLGSIIALQGRCCNASDVPLHFGQDGLIFESGSTEAVHPIEDKNMIGMSFLSFLLLLAIGVIVTVVLHYGFRYRFLEGLDAVFAKVAMGWLGAWLLGHWWFKFENVYIIPAILGSITSVLLNVVVWKALDKVMNGRPATEKGTPAMPKAA
jgi:hypothetical protein